MKMNYEKAKIKIRTLSDTDLENLQHLVKREYKRRGKTDCHGNSVSNFTDNVDSSTVEQIASLDRMFEQAWIHG